MLFTIVEIARIHSVYALFVAAIFALPIAFLHISVLMVFTRNGGEMMRDEARAIFKEDISGQLINGF